MRISRSEKRKEEQVKFKWDFPREGFECKVSLTRLWTSKLWVQSEKKRRQFGPGQKRVSDQAVFELFFIYWKTGRLRVGIGVVRVCTTWNVRAGPTIAGHSKRRLRHRKAQSHRHRRNTCSGRLRATPWMRFECRRRSLWWQNRRLRHGSEASDFPC